MPDIFRSSKKRTKLHSIRLPISGLCRITTRPEEREFAVDSGASVHMVSKKVFISAELETMRLSKKRRNPSRGSAETDRKHPQKKKTTKNYEENYCKMCRNGYRISKRIWWIRMFSHINTLAALLMNYQWSREQKWYRIRVCTVFFLTSRKTEIVTSA